jgi:4-amino-4-deoxy-L-arabinose transferase-like glycosyltransferase
MYPFMHSDESWISSLSRNVLENQSFKVTETVFDLYPRYPHAIKIIFQSIQILFLKFLGYNLFSFRIISLIFGCLSLLLFYKLLLTKQNKNLALIYTIMLSFNIQFIYASHFARQEIILVFIELLALYLFINKKYLFSIIICGLSIGVHPNSFIIVSTIGFYYLVYLFNKKISFKTFLSFIIGIITSTVIFISISLKLDNNFFINYFNYGSSLMVDSNIIDKFKNFDDFYIKIYKMISATYYNPDIRIYFLLFILSIIYILIRKRTFDNLLLIGSIIIINLAIVIIGRYNPTSIIFTFPLFYLLLSNFKNKYFIILLLIISILNSCINIYPYINNDYKKYLNNISKFVDSDSKVLANLNTEYYFKNDSLLDYRNLYYLKDNNISFSEYIYQNNIEYIIYSEEMDFIYNRRPIWNIVYGNTFYYYDDMKYFLNNDCNLIGEFYDSVYSMRIVRYQNNKYFIKIYEVKK